MQKSDRLLWLTRNLVLGVLALTSPAAAQTVPDATLPANSIATPDSETIVITGGTAAGSNLFHSFQEFSVPAENTAYFNNAVDIENIFTRVTGGNISQIDGTLRANGSANLFLLNPNGVVFGSAARLNIGGSFFASTANRIVFNDGSSFSATNPEAPPLLTINVPLGLQFNSVQGYDSISGSISGSITVRGAGRSRPNGEVISIGKNIATTAAAIAESEIGFQESFLDSPEGLRVMPGKTLALIGGDITLEGGILKAPAGRIELVSMVEGWFPVNPLEQSTAENPAGTTYGDIQLLGESWAIASGSGGGDIRVRARRLSIRDGSQINTSTLGEEPGGTITIDTSELMEVSGSTEFPTALGASTFSSGNAGNVTIDTERFVIKDGAIIGVRTFSEGMGGSILARASESVEILGTSPDGEFVSTIGARTVAAGDAGDVTIETGRLILRDGALVGVNTQGSGMAGSLSVRASESLELNGTSANEAFPSSLAAISSGAGNAGNVTIETKRLSIRNGAIIGVQTQSSGMAGTVRVNATERVELNGTSASGGIPSSIVATTQGTGDAGNVSISTGQLTIRDGSAVIATTFGEGMAGAIDVSASQIELAGSSLDSQLGSGLLASTFGAGDAGNVTISTERLIIEDGALVGVTSSGQGLSAAISPLILDREISRIPDELVRSILMARSSETGDAGNVTIETRQLIVRNGSQVGVGSFGEGSGGNLRVFASESVELEGISVNLGLPTDLSAETFGSGDAGNVNIVTGELIVEDGARVNVGGSASGNPGSINIVADRIQLDLQGNITAASATGRGGNITVRSRDIILRDRSTISAAGSNTGNITAEGNIAINAQLLVLLEGSSILTSAADPRGGSNISISPPTGLDLIVFQSPDSIINARGELSVEGDIQIQASPLHQVEVTNIDELIGRDLCAINSDGIAGGSSFIITGRSGLPPNPREPLSSSGVLMEWATHAGGNARAGTNGRERLSPQAGETLAESIFRPFSPSESPSESQDNLPRGNSPIPNPPISNPPIPNAPIPNAPIPNKIVEARGWIVGSDGQVILTAFPPDVTPAPVSQFAPSGCGIDGK